MKKNKTIKKTYDSPKLEIIEFSIKDSIATSAGANGVGLWEQN